MTVESLTPITEADLLKEVKTAIGMNGNNYNDGTISFWINSVKQDLLYAGVRADVLGSTLAVGCIARGVDDYWVRQREEYSMMFYQAADGLRSVDVDTAGEKISVSLRGSIIKNTFTVAEETRFLDVGIDGYDYKTDDLQLFVEGLKFDADRYAIVDNSTVRLLLPVLAGTKIEFVVTKLEGAE